MNNYNLRQLDSTLLILFTMSDLETPEIEAQENQINERTPFRIRQYVTKKTILLWICAIGTIITGATQGVLLPLMTLKFPSVYFIVFMIALESVIILVVGSICCKDYIATTGSEGRWSAVFAGIFYALMSLAKVYSSNPNRTPPIMQSTLQSTTIVFTLIFSKLLLTEWGFSCFGYEIKHPKPSDAAGKTYEWKFIITSIICLFISVIMPLIYDLVMDKSSDSHLWVLCYMFGVICRAISTVCQELYFIKTADLSNVNKLKLLLCVHVIQFFIIVPAFGLEFVISESESPLSDFVKSLSIFIMDWRAALIFHGFIGAYFLFLVCAIYLNTISSNYIMIVSVVITPSVTIFFTIFKGWIPDIIFPLWIIIPSLIIACISVFFWMRGEKNN